MSASSKKIIFTGTQGDPLFANLELPDGKAKTYALFAHCFTCSKDSLAAVRISRALMAQGIGVLRFDFTGLGSSAGDFANTNFSSNVDDLLRAAAFLQENGYAPRFLIGHSFGGAAVLAAASRLPDVKAVITIGAPAEPKHITHLLKEKMEDIQSKGEAEVKLAGRTFRIQKQFLQDLDNHRLLKAVEKMDKALLIFHSPQDKIVGIENARLIFDAAMHPKSFISLDNADHLLTKQNDAVYVANMIAAWVSRYIPEVQDALNDQEKAYQDDRYVTVRETDKSHFSQEIIAGKHTLIADEPVDAGGNDLGPSPYGFLLAALGACTAMTIRMYADYKKLPLEKVQIKLKHEKVYEKDCKNCEDKNAKMDHIERLIDLQGELNDEQRKKLLEIANKCPVHRTLTSKIEIETQLTETKSVIDDMNSLKHS